MYKEGFLKVTLISPLIKVGKPLLNVLTIKEEINNCLGNLIVFPELSLTGVSCGDLFYQDELLNDSLKALEELLNMNYQKVIAVGMPLIIKSNLYNVLVVFKGRQILAVIPKMKLVDNSFYNESRWFKSGTNIKDNKIKLFNQEVNLGNTLFTDEEKEIKFGFEFNNNLKELNTKGEELYLNGANLIINLSSELDYLGLNELITNNVLMKSYLYEGAYLHLSSSYGESSGEGVFNNLKIGALNGVKLQKSNNSISFDVDFKEIEFKRRKENKIKEVESNLKAVSVLFSESKDYQFSTPLEQMPLLNNYDFKRVNEILINSLKRRISHLNNSKVIIGVSGGLDSTAALLIAYDTFKKMNLDSKNIISVILPSRHTSKRTYQNAKTLTKLLGVTGIEINIDEEVDKQLKMINHQSKEDITYENVQARIRTQTLMNMANKYNGFVLGTGNLSEIALGFMTYNADQMSMYAINSGMPKTMVQRHVKEYINFYPKLYDVLVDILNTPISPELKENQETEEIVGNYLFIDFLIYRYLECGDSENKLIYLLSEAFGLDNNYANKFVKEFLKRLNNSQFKRQVMPEGPRVTKLSLSPRSFYKKPGDV